MQYDIQHYSEDQIRSALNAEIDMAIKLWKSKDWLVYSRVRDTLIALIRCGRGEEVKLPQMQFIYFVNTHLRTRYPDRMPDWKMFGLDLPAGRSTSEPSWQVATRGDFWSVPM